MPYPTRSIYWRTHFIGRFGDEATLFRLGAQLEETRPWKERHPPIAL